VLQPPAAAEAITSQSWWKLQAMKYPLLILQPCPHITQVKMTRQRTDGVLKANNRQENQIKKQLNINWLWNGMRIAEKSTLPSPLYAKKLH